VYPDSDEFEGHQAVGEAEGATVGGEVGGEAEGGGERVKGVGGVGGVGGGLSLLPPAPAVPSPGRLEVGAWVFAGSCSVVGEAVGEVVMNFEKV